MVVHDEKEGYEKNIALIPSCGLELCERFFVSVDVWLAEYFRPLEARIDELAARYSGNSGILKLMEQEL